MDATLSEGGSIRCGIAGWDYPDWAGVVYPTRAGKDFDRLTYIARFVDAIEINSSFYRPVAPQVAESWVRRTELLPNFRFTAKAHRSWTHDQTADLAQVVPQTLFGLAPLRDASRLSRLLVQFPQRFHWNARARERLKQLAGVAQDWPLTVEVRHASWADPEAADWLDRHGLGWCAVDQPQVDGSTLGLLPRVCGGPGYLRLHGRNAADWFRADAGRDARYDYLYDPSELDHVARSAKTMAANGTEVFVVQNNHFRGQALVNTLQLRRLLQGGRPAAPAELVAAYPQLEGQVRVEGRGLF